jgi:hypothetical protein
VDSLLLANTPAATFAKLLRRGTDTYVICGEPDMVDISLGADRKFRRLARSDRFRLQVLAGLDHSILIIEQRRLLTQALSEYVVARYGPGSPAGVSESDPVDR